ncbi:MAG: flagellar hook capping FlgD N-terminal domain-containing protein [Pseudomonadota bacterium]
MDLQTVGQTTATPTTSTSQDDDAGAMISADFETFLQLLTAQMKHQDPLDPTDSTEFTAQLATFSGVEQQVRTNDLLTELGAGLATLGMGELAGWIGMEARAEMPVNFSGDPVRLAGTPHNRADRMELIVRDELGNVVQSQPVPLSDAAFDWTGQSLSGNTTLPNGTYSFSVQSWSGETMLEERNAMVYANIEEAQLVAGDIWLTMQDGTSVRADAVLGLRNPNS